MQTVGIPKGNVTYNSACAAAGQLGLMSLYETMFTQFDITISQLLVTSFDFTSPERRRNIQHVISELLALGIVPLLNENDAVSANQGYQTFGKTFSDNDSLASLVSVEMSAQLLILLTDVKGVYDRPPSEPNAKVIDTFNVSSAFKVGEKSLQGRGGMGAKVDAALSAAKGGVQAVVIAAGHESDVIGRILSGDTVGTIFLHSEIVNDLSKLEEDASGDTLKIDSPSKNAHSTNEFKEPSMEEVAAAVRAGSRKLQCLSADSRTNILNLLADLIGRNSASILEANAGDIAEAEKR